MLLETPSKPDGLPGLQSASGLRLQAQRSLLQAVKYEALDRGEVDAVRTLSELAGMLDEKAMRTLNRRVEVEEVDGALGILQRIVTPTGLGIAG